MVRAESDISLDNISTFVTAYEQDYMRRPWVLYQLGLLSLTSDKGVKERVALLEQWLRSPSPLPSEFVGGVSLFAELWVRDVLREILPSRAPEEGGQSTKLSIELSPLPLDVTYETSKGGDVWLLKEINEETRSYYIPLLLIDVTLADPSNERKKRRPNAFHTEAGVPTITLFLGELRILFDYCDLSVVEFLERHVKPSIIEGNYDPLVQLSSGERALLKSWIINYLYKKTGLVQSNLRSLHAQQRMDIHELMRDRINELHETLLGSARMLHDHVFDFTEVDQDY